jgi:hypothetical protein
MANLERDRLSFYCIQSSIFELNMNNVIVILFQGDI